MVLNLTEISQKMKNKSWLSTEKSITEWENNSSLIRISMLLGIECIRCSSSLSMEKTKLVVIGNWIFHISDFLRLFMMSFK